MTSAVATAGPVPALRRAALPAELRGLSRDGVALLVVDRARDSVSAAHFADIGRWLRSGDLLVLNSSRTLPAAVRVEREDGSPVQLRAAVRRVDGWDALSVDAEPPHRPVRLRVGESLRFPGGTVALVVAPRLDLPGVYHLDLDGAAALDELLGAGEPIRYSYVPAPVPLEHYQTVVATRPGSAESPSAGRPFTLELLLSLRRQGVALADITLHTGLSSLQDDDVDALHPLAEEWFEVPATTAAAVAATQARGGRVIGVGTTVVRALETAAVGDHAVEPTWGWTRLRVTPATRPQVVDAVVTGLHEPGASHLDMLGAFANPDLLARAHGEGRRRGLLWHEFGDAMLIV